MRQFARCKESYIPSILKKACDAGMSETDRELIEKYIEKKERDRDTNGKRFTAPRKKAVVSKICAIRGGLHKDFSQVTEKDVNLFFTKIRGEYTLHTVNETKSVFKGFFSYLSKIKKTKLSREYIDGIKGEKVDPTLTPGDLLTPTEIAAMIEATPNPMHKALIAVLAESGARIHEVAGMKWSHLAADQYGYSWSLESEKTNPRHVRLIDSAKDLITWRNLAPKDAEYVFVTRDGQTMIYETARATIIRIAKKAGITKKVKPHLFRHSRVTELLKMGMREPELKKTVWGKVSTRMLEKYEHLASADIDAETLRIRGITKTAPAPVNNLLCANCGAVLKSGERCWKCGCDPVKQGELNNELAKKDLEIQRLREDMAVVMEALKLRRGI